MAGSKHIPNTQWNEERTEQAFELALLGYTDKQIAEEMGVHPMTFDYWKRTKPEFFERLNDGKAKADQKVVNAFYANCLDRWVVEEEVHMYKDKPIVVRRKRFIPGDKWAQSKWLALRQRVNWSEVHRTEITQTNVNLNKLDFSGFTEEEKRMLYSIGIKQLTNTIGNS